MVACSRGGGGEGHRGGRVGGVGSVGRLSSHLFCVVWWGGVISLVVCGG